MVLLHSSRKEHTVINFHTAKFERNQAKVEKAAGRKLNKAAFEALALKVAQNAQFKGVDAAFADRFVFIGTVEGVTFKLVILKKITNKVAQGVSLFALSNQDPKAVLDHAKRKIA